MNRTQQEHREQCYVIAKLALHVYDIAMCDRLRSSMLTGDNDSTYWAHAVKIGASLKSQLETYCEYLHNPLIQNNLKLEKLNIFFNMHNNNYIKSNKNKLVT